MATKDMKFVGWTRYGLGPWQQTVQAPSEAAAWDYLTAHPCDRPDGERCVTKKGQDPERKSKRRKRK